MLSHVWFISAIPVYNNSNNNNIAAAAVVNQNWKEITQLILLIYSTLLNEVNKISWHFPSPIINVMYLLIYVGNRTLGVHHTSWMSRTSWYFSQHFPKGYSGAGHTCGDAQPQPAPAWQSCICHAGEKISWCSSQHKPFYYKQMLAACWQVVRLWAFGPNFSSQELSPKALKCTTPVPASYFTPEGVWLVSWGLLLVSWGLWLVSSGLWLADPLARQCSGPLQSAAHFILKGYQSYQNKSSQKLIKICCSLNGVMASQLSDQFWFWVL